MSLNLLTSLRQATLTMMNLGSKAARYTLESGQTLDRGHSDTENLVGDVYEAQSSDKP